LAQKWQGWALKFAHILNYVTNVKLLETLQSVDIIAGEQRVLLNSQPNETEVKTRESTEQIFTI
jgi:hypothetical protein